MTSSADTAPAPAPAPASTGSRATLGLAAAGGVGIMGLIPLTAVVGEWWLLGLTFATLVSTAGLIVAGLFGLLIQTGDAITGAGGAARRRKAAGGRLTADTGLRVPVLRSA